MTEYFGSPNQIAVQKRLCEIHSQFAATPYLSNGGRILNILDPDALNLSGGYTTQSLGIW